MRITPSTILPAPLWVFGYGSLIFRPGFAHQEQCLGEIVGFERRFWQASTDHRGVVDRPGRVVTLIESPQARCAGVAYRVPEHQQDQILRELDVREQGGYDPCLIPFQAKGEGPSFVLTYVGRPGNPHFVGPEEEPITAQVIARAVGPSGSNRDYLFALHRVLCELDVVDAHVNRLVELVRLGE